MVIVRPIGAGRRPGAAEARRESRTLIALADGLTTHVLIERLTPVAAREVLTAYLARLGVRPESRGQRRQR